jgi:citryl-CoA lyase
MAENKMKTAITKIEPGNIRIRGYNITELMDKKTFAEVFYLLLKGELPGPAEAKMMEAILVSSVDHGVTPPSSLATRVVASGGNPLNACIAGGILTIGESHGGAMEQCARILQEWAAKGNDISDIADQLVAHIRDTRMRMPGFGHRLHNVDPRTVKLFEIADKNNFSGKHIQLAKALEEKLAAATGKKLPINVDGAIGAVMSDMGFDYRLGKGFFIVSRCAGLIAHAYEEMTRYKPMRKLGLTDYEYDGPPDREVNA